MTADRVEGDGRRSRNYSRIVVPPTTAAARLDDLEGRPVQGRAGADPDRPLIERTLTGDLAAFESLVRRHERAVLGAASRIAGRDEAADVAQDSFLRAFHTLPRFRGEAPFEAWLLRITRNTALNALARRRPVPAEPGVAPGEERRAPSERTPAERLESAERRERLGQKLALLDPPHRTVLVLRDVEGLAYEEIAELTDTPLGTVKGRLFRARRELIELLRSNTYDWELPA